MDSVLTVHGITNAQVCAKIQEQHYGGLKRRMDNEKTFLISRVNQIADESPQFYESLILGQQVYSSLLFTYCFLNISQEAKLCNNLCNNIPKEKLLSSYLSILGLHSIWNSAGNGITYKIRKSYVVLGIHYQMKGYDSVYSILQKAADRILDDFLKMPIVDYTHFFESYVWEKYHWKVSYKTETEEIYSEKDKVYRASLTFQKQSFTARGYSKKNAIENLAHLVVDESITYKERWFYAKHRNIKSITRNKLELDSVDYEEKIEDVRLFAEKYGIDYLLLRFALLSRSQMGTQTWSNLGVENPEYFKARASCIKAGLIKAGQELFILHVLDYSMRNHALVSTDMSVLDLMCVNIGANEVHEQLLKLLRINGLWDFLFEEMEIPVYSSLTNKDRIEIGSSIIAAIFISNFSPDRVLEQFIQQSLIKFYSTNPVNSEIDYRYALIAYLSSFDINAETNNYESGNGVFHAEVIVNFGTTVLNYICENESMRYAKKEVWHNAYDALIQSVRNFFSGIGESFDEKEIILFVDNVCKNRIFQPTFFAGYGLLYAETAVQIKKNGVSIKVGWCVFHPSVTAYAVPPPLTGVSAASVSLQNALVTHFSRKQRKRRSRTLSIVAA